MDVLTYPAYHLPYPHPLFEQFLQQLSEVPASSLQTSSIIELPGPKHRARLKTLSIVRAKTRLYESS